MQMVRQFLPILYIMLYSLVNISVYSHVHTLEHCESGHHHEHSTHDADASCDLCYFLYVPQIAEIANQDYIPLPISFEIGADFQGYNSHQTQNYIHQSTNKDPPMFA